MKKVLSNIIKIIAGFYSNIKNNYSNNRKKIINFLIGFFVVLFILTIFNSAIQKMILPKVVVEQAKSGYIVKKVRGNGILKSDSFIDIASDGNYVITKILVKPGDEVVKGQTLAEYETEEISSSKELEKEIEDMELEYQKKTLEMGGDSSIELLKNAKSKAEEKLIKVEENKKQYDLLKTEYDNTKEAYDSTKVSLASVGDSLAKMDMFSEAEIEEIKSGSAYINDMVKSKVEEWEAEASNEELSEQQRTAIAGKADKAKNDSNVTGLFNSVSTYSKNLKEYENKMNELDEKMSQYIDDGIDVEEVKAEISDYEQSIKEKTVGDQIDSMDYEKMAKDLEEKKNNLENADKQKCKIVATESSVVSDILCEQGESVIKYQNLFSLYKESGGYVFSIPVNKSEIDSIKIGDEATFLNVWDDDATCVLTDIKVNPDDPDKSKLVYFSAKGEKLNADQNVAISVGSTEQYYDTIVPLRAIKEDISGKFVYVLRTKTAGVTTRYYVEKVFVEVIDTDDNKAAVSSGISESDYVVVQSLKDIENMDKVRIND